MNKIDIEYRTKFDFWKGIREIGKKILHTNERYRCPCCQDCMFNVVKNETKDEDYVILICRTCGYYIVVSIEGRCGVPYIKLKKKGDGKL